MAKCASCHKYMFKPKAKCKPCLKKLRLQRKANSRGRPKSSWREYLNEPRT